MIFATRLITSVLAIFCLVQAASAEAGQEDRTQEPADEPPIGYGPPISLEEAMKLVDRGIALAGERDLTMAIAIVEPSGELVVFAKMDDVVYASAEVAKQKARSAARFRMSTHEFEARVTGGRMVLLSSDEVMPIGGGLPIVVDRRVIGAVGVSGGAAADDAMIAAAMLER